MPGTSDAQPGGAAESGDAAAPAARLPQQSAHRHPPVAPEPAAVRALRSAVAGPVLVRGIDPDDALACESAAWNLAVGHRPTAVVGATRAADVVAAVRFAVSEGLSVAVQGTGHGAHAAFHDGVLVTTRRLDDVSVDPLARTAHVGAGAVWRQVIAAAAPHGLAPLSGSASGVGVAGYTLGGGMGLLGRRFGFAADRVRSLEVVTADCRLRHVDADEEPDLFWALRGGKGAFGVVTALELELVEVPELTAGAMVFAGEDAPAVLHAWQAWARTLDERTSTSVALLRLPDAPMVPERLRGVLSVHVRVAHLGPREDADELLRPLRSCASAMVDDVAQRALTDLDAVHRDPVDPSPVQELGATLHGFPAAAVDALLAVAGPGVDLPLTMVEVRLMGGALGRPPAVPNAVAGRDGAFSLLTVGLDVPGVRDPAAAAADAVHEELADWRCDSNLTNWLGRVEDREQVSASWSFAQQARLRATKTLYDPLDVFSHGHCVLPSAGLADLAADEAEVDTRRYRYWDVDRCRWVSAADDWDVR